jgi:predicted ATP-binding protein involved in virulence
MNYQKLFDYMAKEHGVELLETDMQEIVRIVDEMKEEENPTATMSGDVGMKRE